MRVRIGTLAAGLLLLVMAAPAFAQSEIMHVNVPFSFSVGKKTMPAGEYVVSSDNLIIYTLRVRGKASSFVVTNSVDAGKPQHQPSLIFQRSGSQYTLAEIWTYDAEFGHSVVKPSFNGKNMLATQTVEVLAGQ